MSAAAARRIALLLFSLSPTLLYAATALPLPPGFYSSSGCDDPANAALLHFDGKNLTGAHSASCRDKVTAFGAGAFRIDERCPAERVGSATAPTATKDSRVLKVVSGDVFEITAADARSTPVRYRFCGKSL